MISSWGVWYNTPGVYSVTYAEVFYMGCFLLVLYCVKSSADFYDAGKFFAAQWQIRNALCVLTLAVAMSALR